MSPVVNKPASQDDSGVASAVGPLANLKITSTTQAKAPSPAIVANLVANISPDVHARIEAFQNARNRSSSSPSFGGASGPPAASHPNLPSAPTSNDETNSAFGKKPPALSSRTSDPSGYSTSYKTTIPDYSQYHKNLISPTQINPKTTSMPAMPTMPEDVSTSSMSFSGPIYGQIPNSLRTASKPSLSDRRRMNLNQASQPGLSLSSLGEPSLPVLNTVPQIAQKNILDGRRPNKAGLKLNLGGKESGTNLFSNHAKYVDVKKGSLNFAGKASLHSKGIDFSSGSTFRISLDELEPMGELGRGNYGTVTKVLHKPTNIIMAMKEIRLELEETKFSQIIMELEILHKCESPYIVDFYGAFFVEGAVYVCMEYMDGGSLDKIYHGGVEEPYLAVITDAVVRGLKQLKEDHNIIHRDVKPTNILVSTNGSVKLCDFGVSGNLVASIARTNIGCQSYMAPERIKSVNPNDAITYTVQSDIWSLGLSILEVAKGSYPYPPETYSNIFSQLSAIVDGEPPTLPADRFSASARSFVDACLNKVPEFRPTYAKLLAHPWLSKYRNEKVDIGHFVKEALERKAHDSSTSDSDSQKPALHRGSISAVSC